MASLYAKTIFQTLTDVTFDGYYRGCDGAEGPDLCARSYGNITFDGSVHSNVVIGPQKFLLQQQWLPSPRMVCSLDADVWSGAARTTTASVWLTAVIASLTALYSIL
jgi:hypothetical protein